VSLDPSLLDILVCPQDKGPLYYLAADDVLYNPRLQRAYEVRDGIPVMLVDEARSVAADEHARLEQRIADEGVMPTGTGGAS